MIPTTGSLSTTFEIPQRRAAELIATTLPQVNWKINQFNEEGKTCSAEQTIDLGGGIGQPNIYNYTATVVWDQDASNPNKYKLRIEVAEKNGKADEDECRTLCAHFFRRCKKILERFVANPLQERKTYGSARFATLEDLENSNYIIKTLDDLDPLSFLVGPVADGRVIAVPPLESIQHTLLCGPTGTGKTVGFILPQAVNRLKTSAIFTEATDGSKAPAVYSQSARWRAEKGNQDVYYFNPADLSSNQINLVTLIKTPEDAATIASIIIQNTTQTVHKSSGDDFWQKAERYLVNALLIHSAGLKGNLAQIRRLVQKGPQALHEELSQSVYQRARDEYQGFLNTGSETTHANVFIGLLQRLEAWSFPIVEKVTERNDIDMMGLRDRLFSFYIAVPQQNEAVKPVASLVLNYLLDVVLEAEKTDGAKLAHPLMLILDEFTNFGRIANFFGKISIIRARGIGVTVGFQDVEQLFSVYGQSEGRIIMNNLNTRIYLQPNCLNTARNISEQLGKRTFYERKINSTGNIVENEQALDLMNVGDVTSIGKERAFLFTPNGFKLLIDRYKWEDFQAIYTLPKWQRRLLEAETELVPAANLSSSRSQAGDGELPKKRPDHDRLHDERAPDY